MKGSQKLHTLIFGRHTVIHMPAFRPRALRGWAVIFRLELVAAALLILADDLVLAFFLFE